MRRFNGDGNRSLSFQPNRKARFHRENTGLIQPIAFPFAPDLRDMIMTWNFVDHGCVPFRKREHISLSVDRA